MNGGAKVGLMDPKERFVERASCNSPKFLASKLHCSFSGRSAERNGHNDNATSVMDFKEPQTGKANE